MTVTIVLFDCPFADGMVDELRETILSDSVEVQVMQ